jgi:diguanylate cyclase (GGDEF)-like protein
VVCLEQIKNRQDASAAARKLVDALNQPYSIHNTQVQISASLGLAMYPDHGKDANTLLRCADEAMYRSKSVGGQPRFFGT